MCAFALPGAMRGGERVGERKNVPRDQEILILGAYRMPIYTVGRDGDFRYEVRSRKRDALLGKTTQRNAPNHAILFADLYTVEELPEFGCFQVGRPGHWSAARQSIL